MGKGTGHLQVRGFSLRRACVDGRFRRHFGSRSSKGGPRCRGSLLHRVAGRSKLRCKVFKGWSKLQGQLAPPRTALEQATRDPASANDRQAMAENRLESIEKLTQDKIAGESQALEPIEKLTKDLESVEKLTKEQNADALPMGQVATAERTTTEQAAYDRQAMPENRLESIEKVQKAKISGQECMRCGSHGASGTLAILCADCKTFLAAADRAQELETSGQPASAGQQAGSSGRSVYEIDDRTPVQCTRAVPKNYGTWWTRF